MASPSGLLTTIARGFAGQSEAALEGCIFVAGAVIQWLRDGLSLPPSAEASETIAAAVPDSSGVYFGPAFASLGAPHRDPHARGAIVGLTQGVTRAHFMRPALESVAYQTRDTLEEMQRDICLQVAELPVDGGAAANNLLIQFQANLLGIPVESAARGAAHLAGLTVGVWRSQAKSAAHWPGEASFFLTMTAKRREELYEGCRHAVEGSRGWPDPRSMTL